MKKVEYNSLVPGDILLVHGSGFISKSIQYFMGIYKKRKGIPKSKLYNHAAIIIEVWGRLYAAEALATGINIAPLEQAYPEGKWENIKVRTPKKPYNKEEQELISKIAVAYAFTPTRYGYGDLLAHAAAIISGKGYDGWVGKKEERAEKRQHCTEYCATCANKVRPNTYEFQWHANPVDIEINKYYVDKEM